MQTSLTEALNNHAERDIIERPFQRYLDFCKEINESHPQDLWYRHEVSIHGISVAIAGLCSPLLSFNDDDERDRLRPGCSLFLSPPQEVMPTIMLRHSTIRPLDPKDRATSFRDVDNWADLVLTGHEHAAWASITSQFSDAPPERWFCVSG